MAIRILLSEGNEIIRNGLKLLLEQRNNFTITAEAADGQEALVLLKEGINADVLLIDPFCPTDLDLGLIKKIRDGQPATKLIAFTGMQETGAILNAFKAGVSGYLLKNISAAELIFGIGQVCGGKNYLCNELSVQMIGMLINDTPFPIKDSTLNIDFSKRELEILTLMAGGFTNQEIADKLFTSRRTVEGHRQSLIDKTGVRNAPALIGFAVRNGIIN